MSWRFLSEDNGHDRQLPHNAQLSSFGQELLITEANLDNAGRYECVGLNTEIGPAVTSAFRVTVECKLAYSNASIAIG